MARCTSLKRLRQIEDNLVSESARLLFMIFCFVLVYAPKYPEGGIAFVAMLECFAAILFITTMLPIEGEENLLKEAVKKTVQENAIEAAQAEMECENDDVVVKPSVRTCSNPPEASPQIWKPTSELNVKLELEYSTITDATQVFEGETRRKSMSTITHSVVKQDSSVCSSSSCDRSRSIECKVEAPLRRSSRIHNKVTSQYSVGEMRSSEKMSSSTHSVLKPESSVGSFSSFHRSSECKAKVPLRRSTRIRNKVIAEECKVEAPGKKVMSRECKAEVAVRRSRRIHKVTTQPSTWHK